MNLYKLIATENDCYKTGRKIKPTGIMWHSTGANNPNLRRYVGPDDGRLGINPYRNYWNRSGLSKCVHAFIGKLKDGSIATYQILPWDHRGWHAGGAANNTHISFEICEDGLNDKAYAMAVYREAVELSAYLCKMFGIDPMAKNAIIDHKEGNRLGIASNHKDVLHWFGRYDITLDKIRRDIKAEMTEKPAPAPEPKPARRVVRLEAGTPIYPTPPPDWVEADGKYTIVEEVNGWGRLLSGRGWVSLPEVK